MTRSTNLSDATVRARNRFVNAKQKLRKFWGEEHEYVLCHGDARLKTVVKMTGWEARNRNLELEDKYYKSLGKNSAARLMRWSLREQSPRYKKYEYRQGKQAQSDLKKKNDEDDKRVKMIQHAQYHHSRMGKGKKTRK